MERELGKASLSPLIAQLPNLPLIRSLSIPDHVLSDEDVNVLVRLPLRILHCGPLLSISLGETRSDSATLLCCMLARLRSLTELSLHRLIFARSDPESKLPNNGIHAISQLSALKKLSLIGCQ